MTALGTPEELAALLGRCFTAPQHLAAALSLELVSAAIRDYTRQTLTFVVDDEVVLFGDWGPVLRLPERPVIEVTAVAINGVALVADRDYWWPGKDELLRSPRPGNGQVNLTGDPIDYWGGRHAGIQIIYSHGFTPVPDALAMLALMCARRLMVNIEGVLSETLDDQQITYMVGAGGFHLFEFEEKILDKYRQRSFG